ncbi:unnamed protein product [Ilex paraguariensis]|uniref:Uncharacterized protein n=1 Tax=Ilex paraguariensis TaxID=185542 RepID=A0ABC8RY83_9AQUA
MATRPRHVITNNMNQASIGRKDDGLEEVHAKVVYFIEVHYCKRGRQKQWTDCCNSINSRTSLKNSLECGRSCNAKAAAVVGEVLAMRLKVVGLEQGRGKGIHVDVNKEIAKKGFKNQTNIWTIVNALKNNGVKLNLDDDDSVHYCKRGRQKQWTDCCNSINSRTSLKNSLECGRSCNAKAAAVVGEVLAMRLKVVGLEQGRGKGIHVDVNKEIAKKGFKNQTNIWTIVNALKNNGVKLNLDDDDSGTSRPTYQ